MKDLSVLFDKMDLFSDLPEPASETSSKASTTGSTGPSTFPTFPARVHASSASCHQAAAGLFGNLPPAAGGDAATPAEKRKYEEVTENGTSLDCGSHKRQHTALYRLHGYLAERKGEREEMQDAHYLSNDFTAQIHNLDPAVCRVAYYGLYDGHCGLRAAVYTAEHLHSNIAQRFPKGGISNIEKDMKRTLVDAFKRTDEDFLKLATRTRPAWKDGTTAVAVLAVNNTLYISNLGDSKAVLCRQLPGVNRYAAVPLTKDHTPLSYDERIRIQKAGGQVRDGRVMGQLELSRSIGDGPYKKHGVTCIPDVKRCQLTGQDRYVLIACDGLWKRFDNESAVTFINTIVEDSDVEATETKTAEDIKFETACNRLASEAVRRLSADNVTVILVAISQPK